MKRPAYNHFLFFIASVMILTSCTKSVELLSPLEEQTPIVEKGVQVSGGIEFVPNEVLVKFKQGGAARSRESVLELVNGSIKEQILTEAMEAKGDDLGLFLISTPMKVDRAVAILKEDDRVEYAEPNYIYHTQATSNDPMVSNLWGMSANVTIASSTFGSQALTAWTNDKIGPTNVYVGIIDEGAMFNHEDLLANFGNPREIAGDKKDNDLNGFVDDVYGWDFVGRNNTVFDALTDDHGTHVAGTIGAIGGNARGVAGVCWKVKMLNAKFIGTTGGTAANAVLAIDYFTNLKNKGLNIVATNNSWSGWAFSQAIQDAITRSQNAGILFIAAAGNGKLNLDATNTYPAGYPNDNIISVTAIDELGNLAPNANIGFTRVDVGAPGTNTLSTIPVADSRGRPISGYGRYSGTSQATAHVTGAVALYKSIYPTATAAQIKAAILGTVTPTTALTNNCLSGGRVNVSGF
jgi:subtilisin family serine protease